EEAGDAADEYPAIDRRAERDRRDRGDAEPREAPHGRKGGGLLGGVPEQQKERQERAEPGAGGEDMHALHEHHRGTLPARHRRGMPYGGAGEDGGGGPRRAEHRSEPVRPAASPAEEQRRAGEDEAAEMGQQGG